MTGDKNDGNAMPVGDETVLQVDTGQARHLHIGDETRCIVQLLGLEKFLCRTERAGVVAQRSEEFLQGFACRLIVIDNRNHEWAPSCQFGKPFFNKLASTIKNSAHRAKARM